MGDLPHKWYLPGWRIEQRFAPGVLIGNWSEDRYGFNKGEYKHNSTHRTDFKDYSPWKPDVVLRRRAQLNNEGLGKEFIFYHHGNKYSNNMISWYDEHYNHRPREAWDQLPELRTWDSNQLAWIPEKSDYPMQGAPTRFGLYEGLQKKWDSMKANETHGDYETTYRHSYLKHKKADLTKDRCATQKERSTTLHQYNNQNKDLHLRNMSVKKSPEDTQHLTTVMV
ncbi:cilia- and flagella-associated protein 107-like [Lineus longissimus]|uniref:cilia- and flagella-associated protein 107-like n=1 Tax=Lineus longissimus TaxID=88925 RepID=UPI002B4E2885